ncbi:MAG: hypothetical protein IPI67_28525 [Myxococcales bacterium]|nr:hypothetical protein [Myxococcales bacterium]
MALVLAAIVGPACTGEADPTEAAFRCRTLGAKTVACGKNSYEWRGLAAGPGELPFDAALAEHATRLERQFHGLNAYGTDVTADLSVAVTRVEERKLIADFVAGHGWDFEAFAGRSVPSVVDGFGKTAGMYAGAGIAADAFRYATLRDQGAECADIERARQYLAADLEVLHKVTAITGIPGGVARGFMQKELAGSAGVETTPLFDENGAALPIEKDNGTWRADNSGGTYPDTIWEDSCSRDMFSGWVFGYASAWEAIHDDPAFAKDKKARLQADASAIGRALMEVGAQGYDLELKDPDGRRTYHGILNENSIDRLYVDGAQNGFNGLLALGSVAALAYVSEDPTLNAYLEKNLIRERALHTIARDNMLGVDLGVKSNYSSYNMAFLGGWLAVRYLCDEDVRSVAREAVQVALYDRPGQTRQPLEQKQSFFDLGYVAAVSGTSAFAGPSAAVDQAALARALQSLAEFEPPPYFAPVRVNCDAGEIAAGKCVADDGSALVLLGYVGRGDELVAAEPLPMRTRPPSNYHWRSNPYAVDSPSDGSELLSGVDFRVAYWMARFTKR